MSDEHIWTQHAAAYALGALDADERTQFESHLAGCPVCRAEVRSYEEATALIAQSVPQVRAPAHLKARVLEGAREVRPITTIHSAPLRAAPRPHVAHKPRAKPRRFEMPDLSAKLPWLAAAAAFILAVGLGIFYAAERSAHFQARAGADTARAQLATARSQLAHSDSLIATLLAPDVQTTTLAAQGRPPSARIYYNRARRAVVVAAFDLPPAPNGRTYQLWGITTGEQPVSLGTFNTSSDARAIVNLPVQSAAQFNIAAVTEEPAGGSPQPTTQPFLVGTLSR
jgi:anti-sigma-K factor RskA